MIGAIFVSKPRGELGERPLLTHCLSNRRSRGLFGQCDWGAILPPFRIRLRTRFTARLPVGSVFVPCLFE